MFVFLDDDLKLASVVERVGRWMGRRVGRSAKRYNGLRASAACFMPAMAASLREFIIADLSGGVGISCRL